MLTRIVPIEQLRPGGEINVRQHGQKDGLLTLKESIKAHGLLQPLSVVQISEDGPEAYKVIDGNRRLAVLKQIAGKKSLDVPILIRDADDRAAREASVAANMVRVAVHPVDEYRAFAALVAEGVAVEDIAKRFNQKPQWVRQRLGLAALAPKLLDEWLAGKMDEDQAAALTLIKDHDAQRQFWESAKKSGEWSLKPDSMRASIRREHLILSTDKRLVFVGPDAYRAAGGTFRGDLFSDNEFPDNVDLLDRLTAEKMQSAVDELTAEGWAFVEVGSSGYMPEIDWTGGATEAEIKAHRNTKNWNEKQKIVDAVKARMIMDPEVRKRTGVCVSLDYEGKLRISRLLVRGQDDGEDDDQGAGVAPPPRPVPSEPEPPAAPEAPAISQALATTLSETLTVAMSKAIVADEGVALAALVAALEVSLKSYHASPIALRSDGWSGLAPKREDEASVWPFAFRVAMGLPMEERLRKLAELIAPLLDLRVLKFETRRGWTETRDAAISALADALPAAAVNHEIAAAFDAASYFAKVNAAFCIEALNEMGVPAKAGKKADLASAATSKAIATGWLPRELRTPHYVAPATGKA